MRKLRNSKVLLQRRRKLRSNMSEPEHILWYQLRSKNLKGYKFRRQYSVGNYVIDFYCAKARLAIEVDGDSHYHADNKDVIRDELLLTLGIKTLQFTNREIRENLGGVLEHIMQNIP